MMNVGRFRHKITIQRLISVSDSSIGEQLESWADYKTVHAHATDYGGTESIRARQQQTNAELTFTVRYSKALSVMNEQDYRVIFQGKVFNLAAPIVDPEYRHETLELYCKSEEGDTNELSGS